MSVKSIVLPAVAGALVLLAGCNKGQASADLEERVDALESENSDLRAQLETYKQKVAQQDIAASEAAARRSAAPTPTPSRTPENASTAADNAAQAAKEALDAAQM
jgi:outer membrane murein-binding lipoprotein Lpp